jgi:hypothetical protein
MGERRCLYCRQIFQSSKFQRRQAVCGGVDRQRCRRADFHRVKIAVDPEYCEVCRDSPENGAPAIPITGSSTARKSRLRRPNPATTASSVSSDRPDVRNRRFG